MIKKLNILTIGKLNITQDIEMYRFLALGKKRTTHSFATFEFMIDGRDFGNLFRTADDGIASQLTTGLKSTFVEAERKQYIDRLLGKASPDLESGRVGILVCFECGDLAEGAVGCRVEIDKVANTVRWYDFAWDSNPYEGETQDEDPDPVEGIGEFVFDKDEYEKVLRENL